MQLLKEKLNKYKLQEQNTSKIQRFQEMALEIIKMYDIKKEYRVIKDGKEKIVRGQAIVFKFAKNNRSYLEGKLALIKEKFGDKVEGKAGYLIALLLKKPNWKK
jgi:hypothetical protein